MFTEIMRTHCSVNVPENGSFHSFPISPYWMASIDRNLVAPGLEWEGKE